MATLNDVEWDQTDRKRHIATNAKELRLTGGASLLNRSPVVFDHFVHGTGTINSAVPQVFITTQAGSGTIWVGATSGDTSLVGITGATSANAVELATKRAGLFTPSTGGIVPGGPLIFECRMKWTGATTATDGDAFMGFSDVVTATSSLSYDISLTSTVTATGVTEGAMIGMSSIPTSGALFSTVSGSSGNYYGVFTTKATTAATPKVGLSDKSATAAAVAKDSSYHTFRVELDGSANASFYLDDFFISGTAAATTAATAVNPYINAICRNSHATTATLDYIYAAGQLV